MAQITDLALHQWLRYQQVRDQGHETFVKKAARCNAFFAGEQWDANDMALLRLARRPALTINKILSTIGNVMGEQIQNRTDISFQPRSGAPIETAEVLTKVFRQISDSNQLDWKRTDVFCDGVITSRGFFDVRLDFTDSMMGEVRIERLNPKNVLVDPDAEDYDPDTWNDVMTTKWLTYQDIEMLYGADKSEPLRGRGTSMFAYGYDSIERERDRFGSSYPQTSDTGPWEMGKVLRNIRIDRAAVQGADAAGALRRSTDRRSTAGTRELVAGARADGTQPVQPRPDEEAGQADQVGGDGRQRRAA
jgi:hypothetical protein